MAEHKTIKGLGCEVIGEFLTAARKCVETKKSDGGILGYPATLLLLAITDAIGHGLDVGSGHTRLKVLQDSRFREKLTKVGQEELTDDHIDNLTQWYRNVLAHRGLIAPGVALSPQTKGAPFGFTGKELTFIRVPILCQLLEDVWDRLKDTFTPRFRPRDEKGWPQNPAMLGFQSAVSGITEAAVVAALKGEEPATPPAYESIRRLRGGASPQTPRFGFASARIEHR